MKYNRIRQAQSTSLFREEGLGLSLRPPEVLKQDARHPREGPRPQKGAGLAGLRRAGRGTWALVSGSRAGRQRSARAAEKPGGLARS